MKLRKLLLTLSALFVISAQGASPVIWGGGNTAYSLAPNGFNFPQNATPANPASGRDLLYFKSDDNIYILNSTGTETQVSGVAGANKTLSNLTSPTAINQDLLPGTTNTRNLGSTTKIWNSAFINFIESSGFATVADFTLNQLDDGVNSPGISLDWSARKLINSSNVTMLNYSGSQPAVTNLYYTLTSTATAASTTTLTNASARFQNFTGSTTQTVVLPVTSTLQAGTPYAIVNLSSGVVTVQSSGANTIQAMAPNTQLTLTCISTSGTGTASWNWVYVPIGSALLVANPMTTSGDMIVGGTNGAPTQLAQPGISGLVLRSFASGAPSWVDLRGNNALLKTPTIQKFTSTGTATGTLFNVTGWSGTIAIGDTYSNNGVTYTALVNQTNGATGQTLYMSGNGATSGSTLTKVSSASGPATITFSATTALGSYNYPNSPFALYVRVRMVGGGGGGAGSGTAAGTAAGSGTITTFLQGGLVANGGGGGVWGSNPAASYATASITTGNGLAVNGGIGTAGGGTQAVQGGPGASTPFGAGGNGSYIASVPAAPVANTGAGGGGAGGANSASNVAGGGGNAGAYVDAIIPQASLTSPVYYAVGGGGSAGGAGTSGAAGAAGATGYIIVEEYYQ